MSFCDTDITLDCSTCYEIEQSDCNDIIISGGLTPATVYWLICYDKFGKRYDNQVTVAGDGSFTIDISNYPEALFNPYAGDFQFILTVDQNNIERVNFSISSTTYNCIVANWTVTCCDSSTYTPPTACEKLLQTLSTSEKNECILPIYDFADTDVQSNVTSGQQVDLIAWLCVFGSNPSVAISTDVDTLDYGDVVAITLTPSDITPTNYTFILQHGDGSGLYHYINQAGDTYNWHVHHVGDMDLWGYCDDGTDSASVITKKTITVNGLWFNDYTPLMGISTQLRDGNFSNPLVRIREAGANMEADFNYDSSYEIGLTSIAENSTGGASDGDTLTTFVGANDGFVSKAYSQENNYVAYQTVLSKQPKIVNAGAMITQTKNAIEYLAANGTDLFVFENEIVATDFQSLDDNITIFGWFYPYSVAGTSANWYAKYTAVELRVLGGGSANIPFNIGIDNSKLFVGCSDNYITGSDRMFSTATLSVNTLYKWAVKFTGNEVKIFIDTGLDNTITTTATGARNVGTNLSNMTIGCRSRDGGQDDRDHFDGLMIDKPVIYNSSLSDANIVDILTNLI